MKDTKELLAEWEMNLKILSQIKENYPESDMRKIIASSRFNMLKECIAGLKEVLAPVLSAPNNENK